MANTNNTFNATLLGTSSNLREYLYACSTDTANLYTITVNGSQVYNVGTVWTGTEYAISYSTTSSPLTANTMRLLTTSDTVIVTASAISA